jgi:hypothetical protein
MNKQMNKHTHTLYELYIYMYIYNIRGHTHIHIYIIIMSTPDSRINKPWSTNWGGIPPIVIII